MAFTFTDGAALLRAPAGWWQQKAGLSARLLQPFGMIYGAITAARMQKSGARVDANVICVGNFVAGGAGKTPTALALGKTLQAQGRIIAFLSRGFGGALASTQPLRVDPTQHGAADVGDEPLLLARLAPTFICIDRAAGAHAAIETGANTIIMDDGLQNPSLMKDLRIAVVDGETGIGNGMCVPAGPLRAPMAAQWPHVEAIVILGEGEAGDIVADQARSHGKLVVRAQLKPQNADAIKGKNVYAFAGMGRPEKFFHTLRKHGAIISAAQDFADHHPYSLQELEQIRILSRADTRDAQTLVTTEKDAMRIPSGALPGLVVLRVELEFDDPSALDALIAAKLSHG